MYKNRTNIANEILSTEIHYVAQIKQIVELFLKPLRARLSEPGVLLSPFRCFVCVCFAVVLNSLLLCWGSEYSNFVGGRLEGHVQQH